jgi:hypothetical protein
MIDHKKNISDLYPHLVEEFLNEKNEGASIDDFTPSSNTKVWWQCNKGHQWQTRVSHRTKSKSGCPYCSSLYPTLETCLSATNPEVVNLWDLEKNYPLTVFEIKPKSSKKVWWKCELGHSWHASPATLTRGHRCPYCSNRLISEEKSITATNPKLLKEWDYERNKVFTPSDTSSNSGRKIWWKCEKGHSWQTSPNKRTQGTNCPYCTNQKTSDENNLLIKFPIIASEWDYEKNGNLNPEDVVFGSNKKIHWICNRKHSWQTSISHRTTRGTNCPFCNPNLSKLELRVFSELSYFFPNMERQKKIWGKEFDISNEEYKFCIEVDGYPWHKDKNLKDEIKNKLCDQNNYLLIRIRDSRLEALGKNNIFYKESKSENHLNTVKKVIEILVNHLDSDDVVNVTLRKYAKAKEFANEITYNKLISELPGPGKDKSLDVTHPLISKQFHPTKNGKLLPTMISIGSGMKLWWQCEKGHEWEAYVYARTKGGCPHCSNFKVNSENSLQSRFPLIAEEWHPVKNGNLTPNDFVAGSGKKVWWQCKNGHEWYRSIERRTNYKRGCPYCAGRLLPDLSKYPK